MSTRRPLPSRRALALLATLAVGASLLVAASSAADPRLEALSDAPAWDEYGFQGEGPARVGDHDARAGSLAPTDAQRAAADELGASVVRWNEYGTPRVLMSRDGYLTAPRDGDAVDVAHAFVTDHRELFRLSASAVDALEVARDTPLYAAPDLGRVRDGQAPADPDVAHVVTFHQRFGDLPLGHDGRLTVGVARDGRIAWVSSSVTGDEQVSGEQRLDAVDAVAIAGEDAGLELGDLTVDGVTDGVTEVSASSVEDTQTAELVALPTPRDGVRRAWEVTLLDATTRDRNHGTAMAFSSWVDAGTGEVLLRHNRVDHLGEKSDTSSITLAQAGTPLEQPRWRVFPTNPLFVTNPDGTPVTDEEAVSTDTRELWCWTSDSEECDEEQRNIASRVPWDVNPPDAPSLTTDGNNASTAISEVSPFTPDTVVDRPVSPGRDYDFPWDNTWFRSKCDPATFATDNDDAASTTNLFVMHNRMHDWSYYLGFTEVNGNLQKSNFGNTTPDRGNDPEVGQAQAGRLTVLGRDNANQITLPDGMPGITNQYLWEPLAGAFYGTCTDGAYDMAIVAHEYMHAITNRMHDPESGSLGSSQGQSESWSDLAFAEYFRGFGLVASEDANPLALAPYVTGNLEKGIRNYAMNDSPLNYSNLEYDGNGTGSPHAPGEIWSAVNQDIVERLNDVYDGEFPSDDLELQEACARGEKASEDCPGNRRWVQILFDSFLLSPTDPSMLDSRDAMLAADRLRFDGANQFELWDEFAGRGFGVNAETDDADDRHAVPSFANPLRDDNATVTFEAEGTGDDLEVFVGDYEARGVPVADSDPLPNPDVQTGIDDTARFVPGTYRFIAQADGFGAVRFEATFAPGEETTIEVPLQRNHASADNGASASGDGERHEELIDDTEETNWFSGEDDRDPGAGEGEQVEGRQVTVELAQRTSVTDVQVSAALRPGGQSRFSALRSFEIYACDTAEGTECDADGDFVRILESAPDAFPGGRPRPLAPDLTLRPFDVDDVTATHIRLRVIDNQCTGAPDYQGEANPVNDPIFSNPDCDSEEGSLGRDAGVLAPASDEVRAAELQVFGASVESSGDRGTTARGQESDQRPGGRNRANDRAERR